MISYAMLASFSGAVLVLVTGMLIRRSRLVVMASAVMLLLTNSNGVVQISDKLGVGLHIIVISFVAISLIVSFRLTINRLPKVLLGRLGIALVATLAAVYLSVLASPEPFRTLRSALSYFLIISCGVFVFSLIYLKSYALTKNVYFWLSDIYGFTVTVSVLLILIFVAPFIEGYGGLETTITLFGFTYQRLQADGYNATGVGATSALSCLWLFTVLQRPNWGSKQKALILLLLSSSLLTLVWSGSRGALSAFVITFLFLAIKFRGPQGKWYSTFVTVTIFTAFLFLAGIAFHSGQLDGLLYRGDADPAGRSLVELFLNERIYLKGYRTDYLFTPRPFGLGFGFLSTSSLVDTEAIESMLLRLWVELGYIGLPLYIVLFALLTFYVIKIDYYFYTHGLRGYYFASAVLIYVWVSSVTGFGFSIVTGTLTVQLAIGFAAYSLWIRVTKQTSADSRWS